ncbi:hypothetical protein ACFR9U_02615 [Halorientalis brevis]|uniref:Uncharacterized protein n=1 Tax=Halorientalis brevis TaxID=1126241 RepID=A0ABD6C7M4_9EURY|nr:hypothetical protein [Halorientalis brevis]
MDRSTLFNGSLALYGAVTVVDSAISVRETGLTPVTGIAVVASALILIGGLYGLRRQDQAGDATDSWLAYLMAGAVLLYGLGVVVGQL